MSKKTDKPISDRAGEEPRETLSSPDEAAAAKSAEIESLEAQLGAKEAEATEYLEALKRVQADSENFRKRMLREQSQAVEFASQQIICELLPLVDNLERAVAAAKETEDLSRVAEGITLIHEQLRSILALSGLEAIEPSCEAFDPQLHEAVLQVESDEHEDNTVVEVLQKGYSLKGRVIRPAMVKVTKKN